MTHKQEFEEYVTEFFPKLQEWEKKTFYRIYFGLCISRDGKINKKRLHKTLLSFIKRK